MITVRGEGANHAILDVLNFVEHLGPLFPSTKGMESARLADTKSIREALDRYEDAVNTRAIPAVLASRQASLDANEYGKINDNSPLVTRRVLPGK